MKVSWLHYRRFHTAIAVLLGLGIAASQLLSVTPDGEGLLVLERSRMPELCLIKRTTGKECSSCHLGRSVVLAARGSLRESIDHHRGGVLLLGLSLVQLVARLGMLAAGARHARPLADLLGSMGSTLLVFAAVALLGNPLPL